MAAESETLSVDTSTENQDDPLQDMTDEDIYDLVHQTIQANDVVSTETHMFEKFLERVEPKDGGNLFQISTASVTPIHSTHDLGGVGRVGRKRSKSRSSTMDRALKLNPEQKCDIAQREIEELHTDIEKRREESEKIIDNFKAMMEEADLRLGETKKTAYEFERDIVKGSINESRHKVVAEKVTRYFEDKLRARDTLMEKLRLQNSTLKMQNKKMDLQLKQKEEMGEVLTEVDFTQLQIENRQYIEKIDERNQDLLRLKLVAGSTLQKLNIFKKKLHILTLESERLGNEISSRQDLLSRIDSETKIVEQERIKAERINKKLRGSLADYKVPHVMEYVSVKADLYELKKKVRSWERKVEIADMALKTQRKKWQQLQKASHAQEFYGAMQMV